MSKNASKSKDLDLICAHLFERKAFASSKDKEHIKLNKIRDVLALLGNPEQFYNSVHITGTNGKTSTAYLTTKIINAHGFHCGLFTSPHLTDVRERIQIDFKPISKSDFIMVYNKVMPIVEEYERSHYGEVDYYFSFFDILTIMACYTFMLYGVEFAVFEAGIGGRLDATNILDAKVCVITSVDYDHMQFLGNDLEEIAYEKAGIIKQDSNVFVSDCKELNAIFKSVSNDNNAKCFIENTDFSVTDSQIAVGGQVFSVKAVKGEYKNIALSLFGEYQAHNALLAICVAEEIFYSEHDSIPDVIISEVFRDVKIPSRFQQIQKNPDIFTDVSHNFQSVSELAKTLKSCLQFNYRIGVISISDDKECDKMIEEMSGVFDELIITQSSSARAKNGEYLFSIASKYYDDEQIYLVNDFVKAFETAEDVYRTAVNEGNYPCLVITGSAFLVGDYLRFAKS